MITVARIRADDEPDGKIIRVGYALANYDGIKGWRVVASNGDDVGYYLPQNKDKCVEDICQMWDRWNTFILDRRFT